MNEIVFEVSEAVEGGYDARAVGHSIFTQGSDWTDLKAMVKDAVLCHFDDDELPAAIWLRLVRDPHAFPVCHREERSDAAIS